MPQLRIKNGPQKGKTFQIDGSQPIILGRDPKAVYQIIDKGVSREHAEIFRVGEMVFIRDLGSRNGTFVNEEQLEEELLREGDVIRIGSTQAIFESSKEPLEGRVKYNEEDELRTSLELKVADLFVGEGGNFGNENEHFRAICQATRIFATERNDEQALFRKLMDVIQDYIPADHIYLFLKDEATGAIVPRATRNKDDSGSIPISRTILKRVITQARSILTADAMQDDRFKTGDSIVLNQIRSVLCVPIISDDAALGGIYAVNARLAETFDEDDLELLTAIGTQLGVHLDITGRRMTRRKMFMEIVGRLMEALEIDAPYPAGRARRVSGYCAAVGRELNQDDRELLNLSLAGLLHDLGAYEKACQTMGVEISEDPLLKAKNATLILDDILGLEEATPYIEAQNARWDGTGIPDGLKEGDIPLGARILAVGLGLDRKIYPDGKPADLSQPDPGLVRKAFTEMANEAGTLYDKEVVRALMVAYRHGGLFPQEAGHDTGEEEEFSAEATMPNIPELEEVHKDDIGHETDS